MKNAITSMLLLLLVILYGCQSSSPRGGSVIKGEGFKITVPTFDTKIKQGETQSVSLSLDRGAYFKQDVTLEFKLSRGEGLAFNTEKVIVKAGDKPDLQLAITAPQNAALGEYIVSVTGTPKTGEPTSVDFGVIVVAPDAGYTMQSDSPVGGSTLKGEGFKIAVPTFDTKIKQGDTRSVVIFLDRGASFKQDVTLEIKLSRGEGIVLNPEKVMVKAGDKPDVQLVITVPQNAALGEYKVAVTGTPTTGQPTSVEFNVRVMTP
jgi:uncharacterized membrane protein